MHVFEGLLAVNSGGIFSLFVNTVSFSFRFGSSCQVVLFYLVLFEEVSFDLSS